MNVRQVRVRMLEALVAMEMRVRLRAFAALVVMLMMFIMNVEMAVLHFFVGMLVLVMLPV